MSQDNGRLVQRTWDAWSRGDLDATFAETDPAFEWDLSRFPWPDEQLIRGEAAVRRFFEQWRASWATYEAGVDEFVDLGDDRVLTLCWQRGRGTESSAATEMKWAQILTVRDGRLLRVANYADRAEALEAAGLAADRR